MTLREKYVDILFVGGGPATLGIITNAIRADRLAELMSGDAIAILEKTGTFGGGYLQEVGCNSNTASDGFIRCIMEKTEKDNNKTSTGKITTTTKYITRESLSMARPIDKLKIVEEDESKEDMENYPSGHDSDNELDYKQDKEIDNTIPLQNELGRDKMQNSKHLPMFKALFESDICWALKRYGGSPAPLSLIGMFLNYVGNHVLQYIHEKYKKRIFYPFWEVTEINHLPSGEIMTDAVVKGVKIQIRSRAVVISSGGKPSIPRDIFNSISKDKLITADYFLRKKGYEGFIENLTKNKTKRKIVIIGGSHSGLSWAWMLLNGPAVYNYNKNGCGLVFDTPPAGKIYTCNKQCDCGNYILDSKPKSSKHTIFKNWHCYGAFEEDLMWRFERPKNFPKFGSGEITILYKADIKVFHVNDNKKGSKYMYSFTGLRGDAKKLYKDIMESKEKRVRLIKADSWIQQQKYADAADYVIIACGYQTNKIPIKNSDGNELKLDAQVPGTQFDIDSKFHLKMYDGGVTSKIFGCGLAFPTRTNDGWIRPRLGQINPRADSFALYLNYVGSRVLDSLLPKSKLLSKIQYIYTDKILK